MLTINRIIFPTDSSESALQALDVASIMAEQHSAELLAVNVEATDRGGTEGNELSFEQSEKVRAEVESRLRRSIPLSGWAVTAPQIAPGILHMVEEHDADLILMGTHGRRGVRRLLIGSVAEEVVRLAPCPVLTSRKSRPERHDERRIRSILTPLDFSKHSRFSLLHAVSLARVMEAELDVLHIIEHRALPRVYDAGPTSLSLEHIKKRSREALERLTHEELGFADAHVTVKMGYASDDIVDFAVEHENDLIVIGSHGRAGLQRVLLGSVTERVVRFAHCPVFTLKNFGKLLVDPAEFDVQWPPAE